MLKESNRAVRRSGHQPGALNVDPFNSLQFLLQRKEEARKKGLGSSVPTASDTKKVNFIFEIMNFCKYSEKISLRLVDEKLRTITLRFYAPGTSRLAMPRMYDFLSQVFNVFI